MILQPPKILGTRRRTQVLLLLHLLEESHASELAGLLGVPVRTVQRVLTGLEKEDIVLGRPVGRERRLSFNKRHYAIKELRQLLNAVRRRDPETEAMAQKLRRRPRKQNKAI